MKMKRTLHFVLLSIFMVFTFAACNQNAKQDDALTMMTTKKSSSQINQETYDKLPTDLGKLHNEAIKEFVVFCKENNLTPFKGTNFSDKTYSDFAKEYVEKHLIVSDYPDYERWQDEASKLSSESSQKVISQLEYAIFNCDQDDINQKIEKIINQEKGNYNTEGAFLMIESFCYVSIYSYKLWNFEWDWTMSPLVPESLAYTMSQNKEGDKGGDEKKDEKEDQTEIKNSNHDAKKIAFTDLMGGVCGAASGGGWAGFAVGAIIASLTEYGLETMDAVAIQRM